MTTIDQYCMEGLEARTEILIDRWGVPHIYASTTHDAFFTQGWNAARERLWQIDMWRRSGLGELAAVFGPSYIAKDCAVRLFVYRGDMEHEWAAYGPDAKASTEAFVSGINAYIHAARADPELMPVEFKLGGYEPAIWKAEDVVRVRNHGLVSGGVEQQALLAQIVAKRGSFPASGLPVEITPEWTPIIPDSLDLCSIPAAVLDQYKLARSPFSLTSAEQRAARETGARPNGAVSTDCGPPVQGSNNWVIAASKSTTGRAILANDPHRALEVPSLRYLVHIVAPGLNVIGGGQPALPGVEIGHNDHIAFGFTVFSIAQEDLLVYETRPGNPNEYWYNGQWESVRIVREAVAVRGERPVETELKFTRHGPIVFEEPMSRRAYGVRAAWLDTGGAPYFAAMGYLKARDIHEFATALKRWGSPGENHVCADTEGRIGWFPSGFTPIRPNSDGLLPVLGDGRYEWCGYLDHDLLPSVTDPPCGYVATANQMNLPDDYPCSARRVSFTWHDGARFGRIKAVLEKLQAVSLLDCEALQNDYHSLPARALVHVLLTIPIQAHRLREFAGWLGEWDGQVTAESSQAALFEIWYSHHLVPALLSRLVPEAPIQAAMSVGPSAVAALMARPDDRLGADPELLRDAIMSASLSDALVETEARLGPNRSRWKWGSLARISFEHQFSPIADQALRELINVGPAPKSGDGSTVGLSAYRDHDFRVWAGASLRVVIDVGEWDNAVAMNAPGQSGNPASPHYRDLFDMWLAGKYFPLMYSRSAVERSTKRKIILEPMRAA